MSVSASVTISPWTHGGVSVLPRVASTRTVSSLRATSIVTSFVQATNTNADAIGPDKAMLLTTDSCPATFRPQLLHPDGIHRCLAATCSRQIARHFGLPLKGLAVERQVAGPIVARSIPVAAMITMTSATSCDSRPGKSSFSSNNCVALAAARLAAAPEKERMVSTIRRSCCAS